MSAKRVILRIVAAVSLVSLAVVTASAQAYPNRLIKLVLPFPAGGPTDYARLVWPIGRQRPGMTLLISDGLGETPMDPAIAALQRARQEGAVLQLLAPQEITPDWSGDARLKDAESGLEREFTATPLTQGAYLKALAHRTEEIERAAHRRGLRFARLSTAEPIEDMVQKTLRRIGLLA